MNFTMSFDQRSLSEIAQLHGFRILLAPEVQAAFKEASGLLVTGVQGAMQWKNPNGDLEGSIQPVFDSPYEVQIGSDLPYARRRNWGFDGADSLGRVYHDLGAYYMEKGMAAQQQAALALIDQGVAAALARMGG